MNAGYNFRNEPDGKYGHIHKDVVGGFDYFDAIFKVGNNFFEGLVNIKNVHSGKLFKDVTKIKNINEDIRDSYGENPKFTFLHDVSMENVSQNAEAVKEQYSIKYDTSNMDDESIATAKSVVGDLKRISLQAKYGVKKYASYTKSRIERELTDSMREGKPDYANV